MSVIGQIIAEFVASLAGEALFPSRESAPPPVAGGWRASFGAMAAFLSFLALAFAILSLSGIFSRDNFEDMGVATIIGMPFTSLAMAVFAGYLGRTAPRVTVRGLGLAKIGFLVSLPAMFVSAVALVGGLVRAFQWSV